MGARDIFRLHSEHYRLIVGGVGVLSAILLLALLFIGYEAEWHTSLVSKENHRAPFPLISKFLDILNAECSAMCTASTTLVAARVDTVTYYQIVRDSMTSVGANMTATDLALAAFEAATSCPDTLRYQLQVSQALVVAQYAVVRSDLTPRAKSIIDHLGLQQFKMRLVSLVSQVALIHRGKFTGSVATTAEINQAGIALSKMTTARRAAGLSGDIVSPTFLSDTDAMVLASFTTVSKNSTVKASVVSAAAVGSRNAYDYLASEIKSIPTTSDESQVKLIVYGVGAIVALLALLACVVIVTRHIYKTRRARQLKIAFRDPDVSKNMIDTYYPILQYLKVQNFPSFTTNDVEKEYHSAAKLVLQLRPFVPQALFGDLNSHHKKQPNGSWDITAQNVRLEMGLAFCHCTVVTIAINSTSINNSTKDCVGTVLSEASMAFNIIVEEVNNAGGIVTGFGPNGRIFCVWNATNIVADSGFVAVKTARIIDRRLGAINIGRDLNVASGPCIVSNTKIGQRKHVTFIGGPFDVAEKLLLLNEGHVARLILDYETYKELPREQQRMCKPIAVITDKDETPIVVMSADEDSIIKGEQWKQYNTAFTLYQNNMLSESLTEFRKYLQVHPGDHSATWLIENVLEPKIGRRKSVKPM